MAVWCTRFFFLCLGEEPSSLIPFRRQFPQIVRSSLCFMVGVVAYGVAVTLGIVTCATRQTLTAAMQIPTSLPAPSVVQNRQCPTT